MYYNKFNIKIILTIDILLWFSYIWYYMLDLKDFLNDIKLTHLIK